MYQKVACIVKSSLFKFLSIINRLCKSHYSPKPEADVNNDLFSTRAQPELKTCCYFACFLHVTHAVTLHVTHACYMHVTHAVTLHVTHLVFNL